jgi:hypothetical protein
MRWRRLASDGDHRGGYVGTVCIRVRCGIEDVTESTFQFVVHLAKSRLHVKQRQRPKVLLALGSRPKIEYALYDLVSIPAHTQITQCLPRTRNSIIIKQTHPHQPSRALLSILMLVIPQT